eukprot:TRINITY_DN5342_c0_g3_i1.p1 TRINITY_DN5342_c0_g3~~TRINITY_DN5342_c0_g3_i1.p1  ORF type:complete len:588 (+),score=122.69 TRINITY_DN5342_c0_g3_i1:144-1907(+)
MWGTDGFGDHLESVGDDDVRSCEGSIGGSVSVVGASAASGSNAGTPKPGSRNLTASGSIADCREKHLKCIQVLKRGNQAAAVKAALQDTMGTRSANSGDFLRMRARQTSDASEPSGHATGSFVTPGRSPFATPGGATPAVGKTIDDPLVRAIKEMSDRQAATTLEVHTGVEAFRSESVELLSDLRSQFETLQKESREEAQGGLGKLQQLSQERLQSLDSAQRGTSRALEDLKVSLEANASKLDCLRPPEEIIVAMSNLQEGFQGLLKEVSDLKTQLAKAQPAEGVVQTMSEDIQAQGDILDALQETLKQHVEAQGVTHDALLKQAEAHGSALDELQPKDLRRSVLKLRETLEGQAKRVEEMSQLATTQSQAHAESLQELRRGLAIQAKSETLGVELAKANERCLALKAAHDWDNSAWKDERSRMREEIGRLNKNEAALKEQLRAAQALAADVAAKGPTSEGDETFPAQLTKAMPLVVGCILGAFLVAAATYFARVASGTSFVSLRTMVVEPTTRVARTQLATPRHVRVGGSDRLKALRSIRVPRAEVTQEEDRRLSTASLPTLIGSVGAVCLTASGARRSRDRLKGR